jgi:long-chain acyl-CoA synthetase
MPWLKYYTEEQILAPIPNMSALDYLKLLNNNNLHLPAIEFLGQQITYLELFKKINDTTKSLHALGVKPGEIVTIMLPACPEEVFLFYAIDQIGACANFIFPGTPLSEVENTMEEFNSTKLIILEDILQQPNNLVNNPKIDIVTTTLTGKYQIDENNICPWNEFYELGKHVNIPIYKRNQEKPLFIAKTGGSTGKPKNVILCDRSFNLQVQQHLNMGQKYDAQDRWLRMWSLFSASAAVSSNHLPLCAGMTLVLEPIPDIEHMDEVLLRTKPSHMPLIASCLDMLFNSPLLENGALSFMKSLGCGGEGMTIEFEEKANEFAKKHNIEEFVRVGYGMTENGSGAAARFSTETNDLGGTGIPQINTIVSIFAPDTNEELKYGEEGEICILSSTFMLGYYNDIDSTNSVLKKHKDGAAVRPYHFVCLRENSNWREKF